MKELTRITLDPAVMGGKPCIREMRVTVGMIMGMLAEGRSRDEILKAYPYLESEDIDQALAYAAWRVEEREIWLPSHEPQNSHRHEPHSRLGGHVDLGEV